MPIPRPVKRRFFFFGLYTNQIIVQKIFLFLYLPLINSGKGKGKVHPRTGHEGQEGEYKNSSTLPLTSALAGGGWSTPRPGRFTPGKDPVPIVQEAGWASGPVWTDAENLVPTGIRSPDRPTRSESLYRLRYPGPSS
jgi:hypothetical protein